MIIASVETKPQVSRTVLNSNCILKWTSFNQKNHSSFKVAISLLIIKSLNHFRRRDAAKVDDSLGTNIEQII